MGNKTHVWRMIVLLAVVVILGAAAQAWLRPESWGTVGHYRFDNVAEIENLPVIHQGSEDCGTCHEDVLELHDKDVHVHVECEVCHGPGDRHIRFMLEEDDSLTEEDAAMPKEYTLEGCLYCHRELDARPADFPQIDPEDHYEFLHVTDPGTRCIECHSPHEPLFLLTGVGEARIHPVINECSDCHEDPPRGDHAEIENHPTLFLCRDCHPAVTRDFASHDHSFLRCTACHLFHRESETAGRIFKNGNRSFCLLCHESKPFKDRDALPLIAVEEHIGEMAELIDEDPVELSEDPKACLICHYDNIHERRLIEKYGALSHD